MNNLRLAYKNVETLENYIKRSSYPPIDNGGGRDLAHLTPPSSQPSKFLHCCYQKLLMT